MSINNRNRRLNLLLWLLVIVPTIILIITEANKHILIWRMRIVDFVDLTIVAPFLLIIFISLHRVVFEGRPNHRGQWVSMSLIGVFLYGHAMHLTGNTIDTYSTEVHNYTTYIPPDAYELIHFFDEDLGHWLLYGAMFLLLGLWVIESDNYGESWNALVTGIIMGLGYAISIIESSHPEIGFLGAIWLIGCSIWSAYRVKSTWHTRWRTHPFTAFCLSFSVFLILGEALYAIILGGFIEPSQLRLIYW